METHIKSKWCAKHPLGPWQANSRTNRTQKNMKLSQNTIFTTRSMIYVLILISGLVWGSRRTCPEWSGKTWHLNSDSGSTRRFLPPTRERHWAEIEMWVVVWRGKFCTSTGFGLSRRHVSGNVGLSIFLVWKMWMEYWDRNKSISKDRFRGHWVVVAK